MGDDRTLDATQVAPLERLVAGARSGDREAADRLAEVLAAHPGLWARVADLADTVLTAWVDALAGPDLAARAAQRQELAELRERLAGPDPAPMVRLLVERVLVCWLASQHADAMVAARRAADPALFRYLDRRAERLGRRFEGAVRALASWRRLEAAGALPAAAPGHAPTAPQADDRFPRLAGA